MPEENHGRYERVEKTDEESRICVEVEDGLEIGCAEKHSEEKDAGENESGLNTNLFHRYLLTNM